MSPRGLRRGPVGSVAVRCGERQFRQDPEAAVRAGARLDRATEGGGPLPHSDQSVAAAARVVPGGGSRVVDAEPDAPGAAVDAHQCGAGAGVADDVGQGLLDDAEGGETGAGRDGGRITLALHGDGEPGGPRLFDQFGQPVEAGGRGRGGVAGCTEVGEHLTYLVERLLAGPLDRGEGGPGLFRVGVEQRESDPGLHVDDGDAVGQHVVEFAGHAQPFLVGPSPLRRLALRAGGRPLLTAEAQQFGGGHDGHDPCGDEALLCPGRGPVAVRRQPSVQPVGDQDMPGPQPAQRPPGGLPVPGDDCAEAADGDGDEHRAVRIARREIDQGHRAGGDHGDHGAAMAEEQHDDRDEQQQPRGQVQGPAVLPVLGESGADHDEHQEDGRRHPGQPGGGPRTRAGQPRRRAASPARPSGMPGARETAGVAAAPERRSLFVHGGHARRRTGAEASAVRGDHPYSVGSTPPGKRCSAVRSYGRRAGPPSGPAHRRPAGTAARAPRRPC